MGKEIDMTTMNHSNDEKFLARMSAQGITAQQVGGILLQVMQAEWQKDEPEWQAEMETEVARARHRYETEPGDWVPHWHHTVRHYEERIQRRRDAVELGVYYFPGILRQFSARCRRAGVIVSPRDWDSLYIVAAEAAQCMSWEV